MVSSRSSDPGRLYARRSWTPGAGRTVLVVGALVTALTGCAAAVAVEPAENAADPDCASAMLAMPEAIGEHEQRETTSQATTAYGDPAAVVARCGVPPPGPSTDPCASVNGVDWVLREQGGQDGTWIATTYGRDPAVEIVFDGAAVSSPTVFAELSAAVEKIPAEEKCLGLQDVAE